MRNLIWHIRPAILTRLAAGVCALLLITPFHAYAELGGDVSTVQNDQAHMKASLNTQEASGYTVHEMKAASGQVVREFASPQGQVFGVAWQGPAAPDMKQLLGQYFDQYIQAAQDAKAQRHGRGPLVIQEPGFVLQMGGHMRAIQGRAYIPNMIPANVSAQTIR